MSRQRVSWPRVAPAAFDDTCRLIPGRHVDDAEHSLRLLADNDDALRHLVELSGATNSRLQAQAERHPRGLTRADMIFGVPYSKIVNAAFAYPGEGARFHGRHDRGAWYCALSPETCLAEVVHHRVRHLQESGLTDEASIDYRLFHADVHAQDFCWIDDEDPRSTQCLDPDSYEHGQLLGASIRRLGRAGVVYPSVRHHGGTCLAVMQPAIMANLRLAAHYQITIGALRLTDVRKIDVKTGNPSSPTLEP